MGVRDWRLGVCADFVVTEGGVYGVGGCCAVHGLGGAVATCAVSGGYTLYSTLFVFDSKYGFLWRFTNQAYELLHYQVSLKYYL